MNVSGGLNSHMSKLFLVLPMKPKLYFKHYSKDSGVVWTVIKSCLSFVLENILSLVSVLLCLSQHAAVVLLHHPCVPARERMFLSVLARSCLTHYILTSHPQLQQQWVRQAFLFLFTSGLPHATSAKVLLTLKEESRILTYSCDIILPSLMLLLRFLNSALTDICLFIPA